MAEQAAEVARRCQEAKETLRLELGGCDLRKFPDAVFFLMKDVELQSLSLAGNSLAKIPNKLSQKLTTITCRPPSEDLIVCVSCRVRLVYVHAVPR